MPEGAAGGEGVVGQGKRELGGAGGEGVEGQGKRELGGEGGEGVCLGGGRQGKRELREVLVCVWGGG